MNKHNIKAKSHILNLLGNELIGNDGLAIFEIVKNSYDADAETVSISFVDLNTPQQKIIIEDDGHGMTTDIIKNVWLTIGTDHKRGKNRLPSSKYGRISLGNKGVGRLAVHKLAQVITLETQAIGDSFSNRFTIDWEKLIKSKEFIQELEVEIEKVDSSLFEKGHGTRIILSGLNSSNWTKAGLRELVRKIENIKNPFSEIDNFSVHIDAGEYNHWLTDIKSSTEILKDSLYQFKFEIEPQVIGEKTVTEYLDYLSFLKQEEDKLRKVEEKRIQSKTKATKKQMIEEMKLKENIKTHLNTAAKFKWKYFFNAHPHTKISKRKLERWETPDTFMIGDLFKNMNEEDHSVFLRNRDLINIGNIKGRYYAFNQNSKLLSLYFGGQITAVKDYIQNNCGVKIYRDNIRVYNYGEPYDDWLKLDLLKIQRTADHFGKKVTIGAIELKLDQSEKGLIEKTNREGFNENQYYDKFQTLVRYTFQFFEKTAAKDKDHILEYIDDIKNINKPGLSETLHELNNKLKEKKLEKQFAPLIQRVEKDYNDMRDIMLNSGMTGLNLGVVFHEIDREMNFINNDLKSDTDIDIDNIRGRVKNLIVILETFSPILKQNQSGNILASALIEKARNIHRNRYNYHQVIFSSPILTNEASDFKIKGPMNLLIAMLSNLIDNSIYWLRVKQDEDQDKEKKYGILITSDLNTFDAPALIIADNGTGFSMEPEEMVQPFRTNKPGGMGLGLYYTDMVMKLIGGKMTFPDSKDMNIPDVYNGACIALIFPKNTKQ